MDRSTEQELREYAESQARIADVLGFVSRLRTRAERIAVYAEIRKLVEAEARTAPPAPPPTPVETLWTPPEPPSAPDLPGEGFIVDPASVDRLEALVRGAEDGTSVEAAAACLRSTAKIANHTLRQLAHARGTVEYSRALCRWYAKGGIPKSSMTLRQAVTHVMAEGETLGTHEIWERVREYKRNASMEAVRAEVHRMVIGGELEDCGPSPRGRGSRLYRVKGGASAVAVH